MHMYWTAAYLSKYRRMGTVGLTNVAHFHETPQLVDALEFDGEQHFCVNALRVNDARTTTPASLSRWVRTMLTHL